jgi:hypothetical protein
MEKSTARSTIGHKKDTWTKKVHETDETRAIKKKVLINRDTVQIYYVTQGNFNAIKVSVMTGNAGEK